MFSELYWNQPVCTSVLVSACVFVHVSVFVQKTSFCQSGGGGIKVAFDDSCSLYLVKRNCNSFVFLVKMI